MAKPLQIELNATYKLRSYLPHLGAAALATMLVGWRGKGPVCPDDLYERVPANFSVNRDTFLDLVDKTTGGSYVPYYTVLSRIRRYDAATRCPLKAGDIVHVVRKAERGEFGWENTWVREMDHALEVGGTIRGTPVANKSGTCVMFIDNAGFERLYQFPRHVLRLVKRADEETAIAA